ncbi:MAG: peptidylprolyl isomerase, partial [Gemmatimonadetes bacterium]|nr:peptidylprolyl isomerase [Gemmatimonadota bacterium]
AFPLGVPFFDGSRFQRVVPGHVIQGGGANSEVSTSSRTPIPNEIHPDLSHDHAGAVGMANGGPHTATNQFYITLGDRSYLDGDYAVFAEVVRGIGVLNIQYSILVIGYSQRSASTGSTRVHDSRYLVCHVILVSGPRHGVGSVLRRSPSLGGATPERPGDRRSRRPAPPRPVESGFGHDGGGHRALEPHARDGYLVARYRVLAHPHYQSQ